VYKDFHSSIPLRVYVMLYIREELLHPVFSHFPLALLPIALLLKCIEIYISYKASSHQKTLNLAFRFTLGAGLLSFLVTLYLGDSALDQIKNDFCQLSLISRHEDHAYWALPFFLVALALDPFTYFENFPKKLFPLSQIFLFLFMIGGNFYLFKTGHSGGELVYEHGAAVKAATQKCP
jgi:uncharacterized membrane protein